MRKKPISFKRGLHTAVDLAEVASGRQAVHDADGAAGAALGDGAERAAALGARVTGAGHRVRAARQQPVQLRHALPRRRPAPPRPRPAAPARARTPPPPRSPCSPPYLPCSCASSDDAANITLPLLLLLCCACR